MQKQQRFTPLHLPETFCTLNDPSSGSHGTNYAENFREIITAIHELKANIQTDRQTDRRPELFHLMCWTHSELAVDLGDGIGQLLSIRPPDYTHFLTTQQTTA